MTYLGWLGIEQTETYAIIKKISKKKFKNKELKELKDKLLKGWIEHTGKEEGFEKTWDIVEAFSKYAFNASHAYSYAYDSVYGAYLKANYPYEFYSVMMQHLSEKGDKDKVTAYKQEMQQAFGIKNGDYKFGLDNREFSIDKEHSCINPSLMSIKSFSQALAETLYMIGKNKYNSFVDLLEMMRNEGISESRIVDLIHMSYFSDFGSMSYLMSVLEYFKVFYKNKKYLQQCKKETMFQGGIDFDIIRKHCESETVKMFMKIDAKAVLNDIVAQIPNEKDSFKEIIQKRLDVLGYIDIVDKKYAGYCVALDLNVDYSPRLKLYALANGNTIPVKVSKKIYKDNPIRRGDIVKVEHQYRKPKMKKVDGEWIETDEKEWWISEYKIC